MKLVLFFSILTILASSIACSAEPAEAPESNISKPVSSATSSSEQYRQFDSSLAQIFENITENEFAASDKKAGISIAVYTENTIWKHASGIADTGVLMTTSTPILIGSTSKTFLSALVLNQINQGLYSLEDTLFTLLKDNADFISLDKTKINPDLTIAQLLSMTSGLADYNENADGKRKFFSNQTWSPVDNIKLIQSRFTKPGEFLYNDSNLTLLGLIAEEYGKETLLEQYQKQFFVPLNIEATTIQQGNISSNTARPYGSTQSSPFGNMIEAVPYDFQHYLKGQGKIRWACCNLVSTPENLARWGYELYSKNGSAISTKVRKSLLDSMSTKSVQFAGAQQNYGYLSSKRYYKLESAEQLETYGHPGGGGGYSSALRYAPDLDLSISILANSVLKTRSNCSKLDTKHCIASQIFAAYEESVSPK